MESWPPWPPTKKKERTSKKKKVLHPFTIASWNRAHLPKKKRTRKVTHYWIILWNFMNPRNKKKKKKNHLQKREKSDDLQKKKKKIEIPPFTLLDGISPNYKRKRKKVVHPFTIASCKRAHLPKEKKKKKKWFISSGIYDHLQKKKKEKEKKWFDLSKKNPRVKKKNDLHNDWLLLCGNTACQNNFCQHFILTLHQKNIAIPLQKTKKLGLALKKTKNSCCSWHTDWLLPRLQPIQIVLPIINWVEIASCSDPWPALYPFAWIGLKKKSCYPLGVSGKLIGFDHVTTSVFIIRTLSSTGSRVMTKKLVFHCVFTPNSINNALFVLILLITAALFFSLSIKPTCA